MEGGQAIVGNVSQPPGGSGKMEANPMHPQSREPSHLRLSRRCCARTRHGMACQSPAISGKMRCRMHGGAMGSGAPRGERNGAYRTGLHTAETVAFRRMCRGVAGASADGLAAVLAYLRSEAG
ncbi:HGGxSTG domain-containing protein [Methylobacterium sp. J-070]|uniref:HGGxSTG domain-containing protein n=1 Tax=Methylobacterium sp. J-070 TaxID=2836650 RepID=UPI0028C3EF20|nr:HGGxSTG domain-containing protein [Methylobacterium sp. J-070]